MPVAHLLVFGMGSRGDGDGCCWGRSLEDPGAAQAGGDPSASLKS